MRGVVVAPQPLAAEVGREILRRGGNAIDAAVAAAFVQTVTDPLMCGIGGMGVAQVRLAGTGEHKVLDFYARFGSKARPDMWADKIVDGHVEGRVNEIGYESINIPGTVGGLGELHAQYGSLPWAEVVRPAAAIARAGVPLYTYIQDYFHYPTKPGYATQKERMSKTPDMARIWLKPDGSFKELGENLANSDYADTLEAIAEGGWQEFYRGAIGKRIAADLEANGSHIAPDDLANFAPQWREPLVGTYRGYTIITNPPPGGGLTLLQVLAVLEAFPIGELEHSSTEHLEVVIGAMGQAFQDRFAKQGDPAFVPVDVAQLMSSEHIATLRSQMKGKERAESPASPGTTHLSVYDADGNCVAITHTLAMGSGVVTPGLGFQYNNAAADADPRPGRPNSPAAGKARLSAMAPTVVLKDGKPLLILGSPGSNAIANAIAQVIMNVVDFGMSPVEAVSVPRVHCEGAAAIVEARLPQATVKGLEALGHEIKVRPHSYDTLQGRIQLIQIGPDGTFLGASDPRRDGGIAAYA